MIYTSKRRKFNDFVKTHNWKYYLLFLILFITIVITVIILSNKDATKPQPSDNTTTNVTETDATENSTETQTSDVKGKYQIRINIANNIISIYEWDNNSETFSNNPIKRFPSAVDKSLKEGVYTFTKDSIQKKVWYTDESSRSMRYYSVFDNINFHSSLYSSEGDKNSLIVDSYNLINGTSYSDSGVILLCSDAKWIYENCSYASEIVICHDETETSRGEFDRILSIPEGITWDPTDISEDSPYCPTQIQEFNCVYEQFQTIVGAGINVLEPYIMATDVNGKDIKSYVYTNFDDKFTEAGLFKVEFIIADVYGNIMKDHFMVTVIDTSNTGNTETTESTEETEDTKETEYTTEETKDTEETENTEESESAEDKSESAEDTGSTEDIS